MRLCPRPCGTRRHPSGRPVQPSA